MNDAVIVSAVRSPIGRAGRGSLTELRPDDMAVQMVQASLAGVPRLDVREIADLHLGCANPVGEMGLNMARTVAVLSDLDHLPGVTMSRACASSLQTTRAAVHAIRAGEGDAFLSVGVESVSRLPGDHLKDRLTWINPRFADSSSAAAERDASVPWTDPREEGRLPDVYMAMGVTAENVAGLCGVSREDQDQFAMHSQHRAEVARESGFWAEDITPLRLPDGAIVDADDSPRSGVTMEGLAKLSPVFREGGTVTAGNACPLSDGAAALVLMSEARARELEIRPLARILSTSVTGLSPEIMGLGPVEATRKAVATAGMSLDDIDLFEINEAFAAQAYASCVALDISVDKVNVHGGAIALGHPFGQTGARLTTTLTNSLRHLDQEIGVATMCVGGGMGMAMVIERLA